MPSKPKEWSESSSLLAKLRQRLSSQDLEFLGRLPEVSEFDGEAEASSPDPAEDQLFRALLPSVLSHQEAFRKQKIAAPGLLAELLTLPASDRRAAVAQDPRFRTHPICDLLQQEVLDACFRRPAAAVALAQLAVDLADRLEPGSLGWAGLNDLRARSWASLANALRVNSQPQEAEGALVTAEAYLEDGTGDLLELARVKSLWGSLRGNQRRLQDSFSCFDQAMRIYRQCGEQHLLGRTILHKAIYYGFADQPEKAIELLREGLALVDVAREPRLALSASHNLVLYLTDLGRHDEATNLLAASRPLYQSLGDRISLMRLGWLEARMARERGELETAEQGLLETREAFIREGVAFDVALVSLELAAVYAEQHRSAEILSLAEEMLILTRATGLHREAMASLLLFRQAAEADAVTRQLVQATMTQLANQRRDR